MVNNLIYVKETPWGKLGTTIDTKPKDGKEIVNRCNLNWQVAAHQLKTDDYGIVPNYYAMYAPGEAADKNARYLGVVNSSNPRIVQNEDMFLSLDTLISDNNISFDCAGVYKNGRSVFGVFKIPGQDKVLDDEIENYIICVNDHLKPDGKVAIIHSPMRVVCTNMLDHAISKSQASYRIPVANEVGINRDIAMSVFNACKDAVERTQAQANYLVNINITRENMEEILDNLFPYTKDNTGEILESRQNETNTMARDLFISDCLGAENLSNYKGTAYQVYNAVLDYQQHYFTKADYAYDLDKRMSRISSFGDTYDGDKAKKFMTMVKKYAVG